MQRAYEKNNKPKTVIIQYSTDNSCTINQVLLNQQLKIQKILTGKGRNELYQLETDEYTNSDSLATNKLIISRIKVEDINGDWIQLYEQSVSRRHCFIEYKQNNKNHLSKDYQSFISLCSKGLPPKNYKGIKLPKKIGRKILEYINYHGYYLHDLGSKFRTAIKVIRPFKLQSNMQFELGPEVIMTVKAILDLTKEQNQNRLKQYRNEQPNLRILETNPQAKSALVILLQVKESEQNIKLYWNIIFDRPRPYHIGYNQQIPFINVSTTDYFHPQSTVYYDKSNWWIADGNGFDISSCFFTYKYLNSSQMYKIDSGSEFRIGLHTYFRFDIQQ